LGKFLIGGFLNLSFKQEVLGMKEFRTKSVKEKERLAERKVLPTRVEDNEFIYELEEDVPVEDILRELNTPAPKKSEPKKENSEKSTKTKKK